MGHDAVISRHKVIIFLCLSVIVASLFWIAMSLGAKPAVTPAVSSPAKNAADSIAADPEPAKKNNSFSITGTGNVTLRAGETSQLFTISTTDNSTVTWQPEWGSWKWLDGQTKGKDMTDVVVVFGRNSNEMTAESIQYRVTAAKGIAPGQREQAIRVFADDARNIETYFTIYITVVE